MTPLKLDPRTIALLGELLRLQSRLVEITGHNAPVQSITLRPEVADQLGVLRGEACVLLGSIEVHTGRQPT